MSAAQFDASSEKADLNQYWYSPATIAALVAEVGHHATKCAFLSSPSLYFALPVGTPLRDQSHVFEFDRQWAGDRGFVFYDFNKPTAVPIQFMDAFDYVVVDPPFITHDVWSKYIETVRLILKKGGKMLFTSVLENHGMLEQGIDHGLFVPLFRPSIPNLTYQYHCFTNYIATTLQFANSELPPEDAKMRAAIRMANDLRESESEFTAQMQNRNRTGEQLLPAEQNFADADGRDTRVMKWTHIPEGLSMYANGAERPPEVAEAIDMGPEYASAQSRRTLLDGFKRGVDQSQRFLDTLYKLHHRKDRATAEAEAERMAVLQERAALLSSMEAMAETLLADPYKSHADEAMVPIMRECVDAYRAVSSFEQKMPLQELAADATRMYKSPLFNRQRELLAEMKNLKLKAEASHATTSVD